MKFKICFTISLGKKYTFSVGSVSATPVELLNIQGTVLTIGIGIVLLVSGK